MKKLQQDHDEDLLKIKRQNEHLVHEKKAWEFIRQDLKERAYESTMESKTSQLELDYTNKCKEVDHLQLDLIEVRDKLAKLSKEKKVLVSHIRSQQIEGKEEQQVLAHNLLEFRITKEKLMLELEKYIAILFRLPYLNCIKDE